MPKIVAYNRSIHVQSSLTSSFNGLKKKKEHVDYLVSKYRQRGLLENEPLWLNPLQKHFTEIRFVHIALSFFHI